MVIKDIRYWLDESDLKTPKHDALVLWAMNNVDKIIKDFLPKNNLGYTIESLKTETGSPYAGYIDLDIIINVKFSHLNNYTNKEESYTDSYRYFIEVKPKINSFGDIMRQLNFYRNSRHSGFSDYEQKNLFILLTTEIPLELKSAFKSQNINIYEYKEEKKDDIRI